jgi:hypothetical protein
MMTAELATFHVPEDPASPVLTRGYIMASMVFYEWGVWCAITLISLLFVIVLWLGTASLDPLEDLAHGSLCNLV